MNPRLPLLVLLACVMVRSAAAAEDPTPTPLPPEAPNMKEALRKSLEEDARKSSTTKAAPTSLPLSQPSTPAVTSAKSSGAAPTPMPSAKNSAPPKSKDESVTMMPKVEVRKERITELDRQVHAKDLEIAKEAEKTQATETDKVLNPAKASGFLSIFGGRSAEVGEGLAKQRVMLLEVERDLVAEMALAKTKEEKADLQKQLDEIKAMRRDLDKPR